MKRQYKNIGLVIVFLLTVVVYRQSLYRPVTGTQLPGTTPPTSEQSTPQRDGVAVSNKTDTTISPAIAAERSQVLAGQGAFTQHRYYLQSTPSDPLFDSNWGQATVQAERAWDMTTGSSDVVVAVVDSGYALDHQDLIGRWLVNSAEQGTTASDDECWSGVPQDKSTNSCDDDDNGYVDDWQGYDFYNDDANVQAGATNPSGDAVDHGTLVAGTIGASANNSTGGAGMDWGARIMPLQVFSDDGEAYTSHVVEAIEYAVDNGADVINLSLGTNAPDVAMLAAVEYATANDVLVVAASGNCVGSSDPFCTALPDVGRMLYPAKFDQVLSVGATTSSDTRASFASYGPELDMVAPGVSVGPLPIYLAGQPTSAYTTASGTSFATPMVAGTAALALAENPALTVDQLMRVLNESTNKPAAMSGSYRTDQFGQGRLNSYRAVLMARAIGQNDLLGSEVMTKDPPVGVVWRSQDGTVDSDEWILLGCRVASAQVCTATAVGGNIVRYQTAINGKAGEVQYLYISGSSLPNGTSLLSVHSSEFAQTVTSFSR